MSNTSNKKSLPEIHSRKVVAKSGLFKIEQVNLEFSNGEKRVFERFYQGGRKEGSTGLGLALVSAICKKSGLQESYEFKDGMHRFVVCRKD